MSGPEVLRQHAGCLETCMGACFPGKRAIFRGHDLHAELKDSDWMDLYLFGITGRRFDNDQVRLLHALWVCTSYPDARIWNNRVAALAGSTRSTPALAVSAALAVTDAMIYGGYPSIRAFDFLVLAAARVGNGERLEDVVRSELRERRIYGYGRPISSADERLPWILDTARELRLDRGPHLRLALDVERLLLDDNPALRMNYAGVAAALMADLGLTPRQYHLFTIPMSLAGMPPCYLESAERAEGTLFPLSIADVKYEGAQKRPWHGSTPTHGHPQKR